MILFAFLLSSGLDMSLPEFEPDLDISGNYVVSEYDVSSDEFIAVEITPEEASEAGIIPAELPQEEIVSTPLLSQTERNSNSVLLPTNSINLHLDSANQIITEVGTGNNTYTYVELQPNVTYTIDTDAPRLILTTAFTVGNSYTSTTDTTFTPSTFLYGFVLNTRYLNVSYVPSGGSGGDDPSDPSGNDPGGSDVDSQGIINAIDNLHHEVYMQNRIIIFLLFISFAYPLIIGSYKNFFGGGKNV